MNKDIIPGPRCFQEAEERISRINQRLPSNTLQNTIIIHLIKHLYKWLAEVMNNQLRTTDLNPVSFFTLLMLYSAVDSSVNPSELSTCTGETRTNMTRICNELEALGLIGRTPSPNDRRRVDLLLTEQGVEQVETLLPRFRDQASTVFAALSDEEKDLLEALLKKLLMAFEQQARSTDER
jgi:MarR family transcriptional repressor of emrRAB